MVPTLLFGMPTKRATAAKRPDLSVKGGGAFRSPEPGLAAKAAAELEAATWITDKANLS